MDGTGWLIFIIIVTIWIGAQTWANQFRHRLTVMENKLNLLLIAASKTYDDLADIPAEVTALLAKNRYNQALVHYCKLTGEKQDDADRKLRRYLEKNRNAGEQAS